MRGVGVHQILEELNGVPQPIGTIALTTSNASLSIVPGARYMVQPDTDCWIGVGYVPTATGTTAGVQVLAGERFYFCARLIDTTLNALVLAGTGNLNVHKLS